MSASKPKLTPFAKRLQDLCRKRGIDNPSQLADALGVSPSGPTRWWNGEKEPLMRNLQMIVRATGCDAHWLLLGDGEMFPVPDTAKMRAFDEMMRIGDRVRRDAEPTG